ncbi:hypothetical protein ACWGOQ_0020085 [Aquimarina sp. M1]
MNTYYKLITSLVLVILLGSCASKKNIKEDRIVSHIPHEKPEEPKKKIIHSEDKEAIYMKNMAKVVLEQHPSVEITKIAISSVTKKDNGYYWNFMNVRTGKIFTAKTDLKFENLQISKSTSVTSF